jgi:uncharacterized protein
MAIFEWRSTIPFAADEVYAWHARPGAFERLTPPWQKIEIVERTGGIENGAILVFEYHGGPLRGRWVAVHQDNEPGRRFVDRQVHGPFAYWEHTHSFVPRGDDSSLLEDHIEYGLPLGGLVDAVGGSRARKGFERIFKFRHRRTRTDLQRHADAKDAPRLDVAVTGATGLIGGHLVPFLSGGGHTVARMVRTAPTRDGDIVWDPLLGKLAAHSLEGLDAVVHLAGETTAGRWSEAKRQRIMASRVKSTSLLAETLASMKKPPRTLVCASAVGFYGDRGDDALDEGSDRGQGFLADVVEQWEAALEPARAAGIRVVSLRFGVVVTAAGGAVARLLPAFRAGAGGVIGDGRQYMSWIALDDLLGVVLTALTDEGLSGVVNATSPNAVTNREFTKTLAHVLHRPAVVPMPHQAIEAIFGDMGREMLLGSQRARPEVLLERGFRFDYPTLDAALRLELGRLM